MGKLLSSLFKNTSYGSVMSSIGDLYVFYLSTNDYVEIEKHLGCTISESDEEEFFREFLKCTTFPEDSLQGAGNKPKEPVLSDSQISQLAPVEIDSIIELYINNNPELNKEEIRKEDKNEDGDICISYSYGDIELPKHENESLKSYLYRLIVKEQEKSKERLDKLTESVIGRSYFSDGLGKSIQSTLSYGESLAKLTRQVSPQILENPLYDTIERMSKITAPVDNILGKIQEAKEFEKDEKLKNIHKITVENKERPFKELGEKLDTLVGLSSESIKFAVKMNRSQTQVANELKESGFKTSKHAKVNIYFSIVVVILTIVGLLISSYSIYLNINDGKSEKLSNSIQTLSKSLKSIPSMSDISRLEKTIESQSLEIKKLQMLNSKQKLEIEHLKLDKDDIPKL